MSDTKPVNGTQGITEGEGLTPDEAAARARRAWVTRKGGAAVRQGEGQDRQGAEPQKGPDGKPAVPPPTIQIRVPPPPDPADLKKAIDRLIDRGDIPDSPEARRNAEAALTTRFRQGHPLIAPTPSAQAGKAMDAVKVRQLSAELARAAMDGDTTKVAEYDGQLAKILARADPSDVVNLQGEADSARRAGVANGVMNAAMAIAKAATDGSSQTEAKAKLARLMAMAKPSDIDAITKASNDARRAGLTAGAESLASQLAQAIADGKTATAAKLQARLDAVGEAADPEDREGIATVVEQARRLGLQRAVAGMVGDVRRGWQSLDEGQGEAATARMDALIARAPEGDRPALLEQRNQVVDSGRASLARKVSADAKRSGDVGKMTEAMATITRMAAKASPQGAEVLKGIADSLSAARKSASKATALTKKKKAGSGVNVPTGRMTADEQNRYNMAREQGLSSAQARIVAANVIYKKPPVIPKSRYGGSLMDIIDLSSSHEAKAADLNVGLSRMMAERFPGELVSSWVEATFDGHLIAGLGFKGAYVEFVELPYEVDDDVVVFGEPVPVGVKAVTADQIVEGGVLEFLDPARVISTGVTGKDQAAARRRVLVADDDAQWGEESTKWMAGFYNYGRDGELAGPASEQVRREGKSLCDQLLDGPSPPPLRFMAVQSKAAAVMTSVQDALAGLDDDDDDPLGVVVDALNELAEALAAAGAFDGLADPDDADFESDPADGDDDGEGFGDGDGDGEGAPDGGKSVLLMDPDMLRYEMLHDSVV